MSVIKGIDISNNNGAIDFGAVASDGVGIVYVKATEGTTMQDDTMEEFAAQAKANGMKIGAYHFLVGTSPARTQAQNFYKKTKDTEWDAMPVMDIETLFSGLSNHVIDFISEWKSLSPLPLAIYSYTSFINEISDIADNIENMPFWEANYNNDPWNLPSNFFTSRVGHQYTETGRVSGVSEKCDVDLFTDGILLSGSTTPGQWIEDASSKKWWYKHNDGTYTKDAWEHIDGKWYFFDPSGWMIYDWKKDGNNWYFLGASDDGAMKTGWYLTDSKWYYFNSDGAMQTGWQKISDKWYFFDHSGAMQTGWIKDNGFDYCMYSDGSMICNCDTYGYRFDTNGHATKL